MKVESEESREEQVAGSGRRWACRVEREVWRWVRWVEEEMIVRWEREARDWSERVVEWRDAWREAGSVVLRGVRGREVRRDR